MYTGTIVQESLDSQEILSMFDIVKIEETDDENKNDRWHIYTVKVTMNDILGLRLHVKPKWYMHFWNEKELVIVFKDRLFTCTRNDVDSIRQAVEYGKTQGIAEEQLDFLITE